MFNQILERTADFPERDCLLVAIRDALYRSRIVGRPEGHVSAAPDLLIATQKRVYIRIQDNIEIFNVK